MKFIWLSAIGLVVGLLAGVFVKGLGLPVMMLIGAATVAAVELIGLWWRKRNR
jgi:hypothetical protein